MPTLDDEGLCQRGRQVIEIEAATLHLLARHLSGDFALACRLCFECKGRLIVLGIGKSGHIARKIAATLASTGSPAFFVHPSEASHGDLGMITADDVVIALSYSGEAQEILFILPLITRLQLPLITLTGNPQSTLARLATVHLHIPITQEACPLGLAPTASTTATLAMGDALALALLEMRGFTEADFALSHPGGRLGKRLLLKVADLMHKDQDLPQVSPKTSLADALIEMSAKRLGMTTVMDEYRQLQGIFTDGDLRRALSTSPDLQQALVKDFMSTQAKTLRPECLAIEALQMMEQHKITTVVITNSAGQVLGVLHFHDLLRAGVL